MKQLSLFSDTHNDLSLSENNNNPKKEIVLWKIFIDGAARNNPGPAGAGIYILKNNAVVLTKGFYLGAKTNNQAEYIALLLGLYFLKKLVVASHDLVAIYSDSQLMVSQLNGVYQIKNSDLKKYYVIAKDFLHHYNYQINHILRHKNTEADALANKGIDDAIVLPQDFIMMMQSYAVVV